MHSNKEKFCEINIKYKNAIKTVLRNIFFVFRDVKLVLYELRLHSRQKCVYEGTIQELFYNLAKIIYTVYYMFQLKVVFML